jgi:predicted GNAT family acetyltransferase
MQEKKLFATIFSALVVSMMVFVTIGTTTTMFALAQQPTNVTGTAAEHAEAGGTTVRDSTAMLLAGQTIPAGSFIHLYDSTPDAIATGHVAAKIPCDQNSNATLTILTGSAPNLRPTELELLPELSTPGELCLYHADLASVQGGNITTDIAIQNPGEADVELPATSTVVIGINKILPGAAEEHHETEEAAVTTAGNSTQ